MTERERIEVHQRLNAIQHAAANAQREFMRDETASVVSSVGDILHEAHALARMFATCPLHGTRLQDDGACASGCAPFRA